MTSDSSSQALGSGPGSGAGSWLGSGGASRLPAPLAAGIVITLTLASFDAVLMVLLDHPMGLRSLGTATFQLSCSLAAAWMIYALL